MRKTITISSNMFELVIKWNTVYVSLQFSILFGTFMLRVFSQNESVNSLCTFIILFDLLVIAIVSLSGLHICIEEVDSQKEVATVERKPKQSTSEEKPKSKRKTSEPKEIKNKVPSPNAQPQPQPKSIQEPAPTPMPVPNVTPAPANTKKVEDMTEADWEELFKMED